MARGMFEVYAKVTREYHRTRLVTVRLQKENLQLGRPSRDANTAHLSTPAAFPAHLYISSTTYRRGFKRTDLHSIGRNRR